jgi:hypothetical protein
MSNKDKQAREQRIKDIFARVANIDPYVRYLEDVLIFSYDRLYVRDRFDPRGSIEIGVYNKDADLDDPAVWITEYGPYTPKLDMDDYAIEHFIDVLYDFYDELYPL